MEPISTVWGNIPVMKIWWSLYYQDYLLSEWKMSKRPFEGWYLEMENHWWCDQLVSSLRRPSLGGAGVHASGGRPWDSFGFTWLARAPLRNKGGFSWGYAPSERRGQLGEEIQTFTLLNCYVSWFPEIQANIVLYFPRHTAAVQLAKEHIWLASLPLFCTSIQPLSPGISEPSVTSPSVPCPPTIKLITRSC